MLGFGRLISTPVKFLSCPYAEHNAGIVRGEIASAPNFHRAPLQVAGSSMIEAVEQVIIE